MAHITIKSKPDKLGLRLLAANSMIVVFLCFVEISSQIHTNCGGFALVPMFVVDFPVTYLALPLAGFLQKFNPVPLNNNVLYVICRNSVLAFSFLVLGGLQWYCMGWLISRDRQQSRPRPIELKIVSSFFLLSGLFNLIFTLTSDRNTLALTFSILAIAASIGLYSFQGWAYNVALFLNLNNFAWAVIPLSQYFSRNEVRGIFDGLLNLTVGVLIYVFLLKNKIRALFPKHPYSLRLMALFIFFVLGYGAIAPVKIFLGVISIAILIYSMRQESQIKKLSTPDQIKADSKTDGTS